MLVDSKPFCIIVILLWWIVCFCLSARISLINLTGKRWGILACREFDSNDVLRLWEVLWTHYLSEHFHLYICVAILKRHRRKIMDEQLEFDTLLKFINDLSGHIELDSTLRDTEALCLFAGERSSMHPPWNTTVDASGPSRFLSCNILILSDVNISLYRISRPVFLASQL